ncbi:hypothetical protein B9T16_08115 [Arthrospira sp. PCC 8006]|uniref:hypothetical protein n=1 Tax=Oscillatoriales TaxID=1150 RepID=UPI00396DF8B6
MNNKLTQQQLDQVIAEVERLSQMQETELDRQQVQEILEELNLPTENLDQALMQVRRREVLAAETKRNRILMIGLGLASVAIVGGGSLWFYQQQQAIAQVYANPNQSRLTLERFDRVSHFDIIDSQNSPTVYYQVRLQQTPKGRQLELGCNWINPLGQLAHQNRYQTRTIDKNVWNTRCRHQLGPTSPPGTWQVEMFLGDRILSQSEFIVK